MIRYHLDTTTPVRPLMADALYWAQLCGGGHYRMVIDVHESNVRKFERWAERHPAVISYASYEKVTEGRAK